MIIDITRAIILENRLKNTLLSEIILAATFIKNT